MTTLAVDSSTLIRESIAKVPALATLPGITTQIFRVVEDPRSTTSQLNKIIAHDPALVARILKVVNSAFYGLPGQIGSVERAIVMLGLNGVKNLAVAASLGQMFRGARLGDAFAPRELWKHCIAVGVAARTLARHAQAPWVDEAFLAGMIHDVGILVNMQVAPEKLAAVCTSAKSSGGDFCQIERDILGYDHQEIGQALTTQWKFPRACQLVAGYHHRPTALGEDGRPLVSLVYLADTLCCQAGHGFSLTAAGQPLDESLMAAQNLSAAALEEVRKQLPDLLRDAQSALG